MISVIIPVYNCERFVAKAIQSALEQSEVIEVVVVNDGSTDATVAIINQMQKTDERIQLYHHPNGMNKGRSATRNLGIQKAKGDFIAFLDADDYFLPNRFNNDFKLFRESPSCDGVYNAIGVHFYRETTLLMQEQLRLTTVKNSVKSEKLFDVLFKGNQGHFSIDGLTVKKAVFAEIGLFNEKLVVAEDTEMFWKMAIKCRLLTGIIDNPLAMRGIHDENVFDRADIYKIYNLKMYASLLIWCSNHKVAYHTKDDLLKRIWIVKFKEKNALYEDILYWAVLFVPNPKLLFSILSIKYFPVIRLRKELFSFFHFKKLVD